MKTYLIVALLALVPVLGMAAERPLTFAVSGVVDEVKVRAGARVQKGDVLAVLDLKPFQAQVQAMAAVATAAQVVLNLADRRLSQVQELYDALSASAESVEQAEIEQANAKIIYETARAAEVLAAWKNQRATLKAPFSGTISAILGYRGQVMNLNVKTPAVVVISTP